MLSKTVEWTCAGTPMSVAAERSDFGQVSAEPAATDQPLGGGGYSEVPRRFRGRFRGRFRVNWCAPREAGSTPAGGPRTTQGATSAAPENEAEVLELLRKEIALLHTEFGPLTVALDASAPRAGSAAPDPVPSSGQANRRFKKGLRRGESES